MAFVQAMNQTMNTKIGVNGATVYTEEGVGDERVTLFTMLNRGLDPSYIQQAVNKIVCSGNLDHIKDLYVLLFQTRDVRGGKGEKDLFYAFFKALYRTNQKLTARFLSLIPEYGCWRDMWELMEAIPELRSFILLIAKDTFFEDIAKQNRKESNLSLLAKWLPREKSKYYPGAATLCADAFFPAEPSARARMVLYRKTVSELNRSLKTVEVNMCSKSWAAITPDAVPGRCLKLHTKAFLNEPIKENGNEFRYPDDADRMLCRSHFQEFIQNVKKGTKKAHGAHVVLPHELVRKVLQSNAYPLHTTEDEHAINQAQWDSIREETMKFGGLGKAVAMCDFSGSMDGTPKWISLALGILISEVTHPAFRDHILSFDAEPQWHSFAGLHTVKEKVTSISHSMGQGLNTNFYKACMCIIDTLVKGNVPVGEEPEDLIVLTDMGFDAASKENNKEASQWTMQLEQIRAAFSAAGGWKPPRIIIWNLRSEYNDFHATANQEGVVQLSGWSPSMLKALQKGNIQVTTPYDGLRAVLDDERYEPVRDMWDQAMFK
jgi:hypothetical protein